jgi:hypothetical protein
VPHATVYLILNDIFGDLSNETSVCGELSGFSGQRNPDFAIILLVKMKEVSETFQI